MMAFLKAEKEAGGNPTIAEVAKHLDMSRTSTRDQLLICVEKGLLEYTRGRSPSFSFTEGGRRTVIEGVTWRSA